MNKVRGRNFENSGRQRGDSDFPYSLPIVPPYKKIEILKNDFLKS